MNAHQIKNGVVVNTIVVESLDVFPDLIEATHGGIGWTWDGATLTEPPAVPASDAARIAALWQAAHDYEYAQVSGSAIGLLAIGVMQAKPKCIAVQAWIKSIWSVYYTRKAGTSSDTDYSAAGLIPHTIPELMAELGL